MPPCCWQKAAELCWVPGRSPARVQCSVECAGGLCWGHRGQKGTPACGTAQLGIFESPALGIPCVCSKRSQASCFSSQWFHLNFHSCCDTGISIPVVILCESHNKYLWQQRFKEVLVAVPRAEGRNFLVLLLLPEPDPYLWLLTWPHSLCCQSQVQPGQGKRAVKEAALGWWLQHSGWDITGSGTGDGSMMQAPACWSCGPSVPALQCQTGEIPRNHFPVWFFFFKGKPHLETHESWI